MNLQDLITERNFQYITIGIMGVGISMSLYMILKIATAKPTRRKRNEERS